MTVQFPPVVTADWLREHQEDVALADVRWYLDGRSGLAAYLGGHIPGAAWVDVDTVLSTEPNPEHGRHPLPSAPDFAEHLGRLGFTDEVPFIAYDDAGGAFAARLVWLLRITGRPAAILSGGIGAWKGELETEQPEWQAARRTVTEWPVDRFATADDVEAATASGSHVVIDARDHDRFTGQKALASDVRSGHIPGAHSAPWSGNLTSEKTFRDASELAERFAEIGITGGSQVIAYCGSGVTACHDLLALQLAGIDHARLYPGSWSAWSADSSRPIATGARADQAPEEVNDGGTLR